MHWKVTESRPGNWTEAVRTCCGSYFHTPAVVNAEHRPSEVLFASLERNGKISGLSVVLLNRCRLSLRNRHASIPSLPALRPSLKDDYGRLVADLGDRLAEEGLTDIRMSSYGAPAEATLPDGWTGGSERLEYRVPLDENGDALLDRFSSHHERYVRQGENAGFDLRILEGETALSALRKVLSVASQRSQEDGEGFSVPSLPSEQVLRSRSSEGWGGTVYAAYDDDRLLSAAYVGWGGARGFYVSGGSTQAGYDAKAAFWMHPAIMADLATRGFEEYNLGGTPAGARENGHPQHGLFRFKSGFGPERIPCTGGIYTPPSFHRALHRTADRLRSIIPRLQAPKSN